MIFPQGITKNIWLLSWATFLNRTTGFLSLFAAMFFNSVGFEQDRIVLALFLCGTAGILSSTIAGSIADAIGSKKVLIGSTALNVPLALGLAFAESPSLIIALSVASVFLSQAFIPPASGIIALSSTGPDRVSMFAFYRIFINVGSIISPAIVGIIGTEHFNSLFLISSVGSAITAIILFFFHTEHASTPQGSTVEPPAHHGSQNSTTLWIVIASMCIVMAIYAQHQGAVPLSMTDRPHGDRIFASLLILNPVLIICLEYPLSSITKRVPWSAALSTGTVIMGLGVAITGGFEAPLFSYIGWILFSIGECIFAPMSNAAVAELSQPAHISKNQGILASSQSAGMALGPALGTAIFFQSSTALWISISLASIVIAILISISHTITIKDNQK